MVQAHHSKTVEWDLVGKGDKGIHQSLHAAVVLEIIFGSAVPYIGIGFLDNIIALTAKLGQDGLVGIIAIGIIVWLYLRK